MTKRIFRFGLVALTLLGFACMALAVAQMIPAWVGWVLFAGFLLWSSVYYGTTRSPRAK
ncbi:MAG: hypothetical protein PIR02_03390 [Microbacterium enclense]